MAICGRHQIGNQQFGQTGLAEVVAQEKILSLVGIQRALQLCAGFSLPRSEDRILAVVFA